MKFEGTNYRSDGVTVDFDSSRPPVSDLQIDFRDTCAPVSGVVTAGTPTFDPDAAAFVPPLGATFGSESMAGTRLPGLRTTLFGSGYCIEFVIEFEANEPIGLEDVPSISFMERSVLHEAIIDGSHEPLELDP